MTFVTDPIGDLVTRMRNAQAARSGGCKAPWSRLKQELCDVLVREGWLASAETSGEDPKKTLEVAFVPGKKIEIYRASKPGRRLYAKSSELRPVLRGYGMAILTTSVGLITDKEARKRKIGGEILCTVA